MASPYTINPTADLGTIDYRAALSLQRMLVDRVMSGKIGDVLLFLDHPPVYTVGRGKKPHNYEGVSVVDTERGGDVTYHGPGQLVVYPIIDLGRNRIDGARSLVHLIENAATSSLAALGYTATVGDEPGIWVEGKKVASIGLAIREKISFHGVALNISEAVLEGFARINPCGLNPSTVGYVPVSREKLLRELRRRFEILVHPFDEVGPDFFTTME